MQNINYFVFLVIFFFITQRLTFKLFITSYLKRKKVNIGKDNTLSGIIKKKTGVTIREIRIIESAKLFGGMTGVPGWPILMLSRKLYTSFSKGELEYVVLHETGHYSYWHPLKEALVMITFTLAGIVLVGTLGSAILWGLVFGILFMWIMRFFEYQADAFALQLISNPKDMITATKKFKASWKGPEKGLIRFLFYRGIPYEKRIEMARGKAEGTL